MYNQKEIMKKVLLLALVLLFHLSTFAQNRMWNDYGKNVKVNSGIGIEQFVTAIFGIKPNEWTNDAVYDKKNGYFSYYEEGAGSIRYNVSYWNRKDGKKLVIMSYRANDFGKNAKTQSSAWGYFSTFKINDPDVPTDDVIKMETGFRAYLYDEAKKQLVPLTTPPFNGIPNPLDGHYFLELPQNGKDIVVCENVSYDKEVNHTLKWNGMTFDFQKGEETVVGFFVTDSKANIRMAPNGKIVKTLSGNGEYTIEVYEMKNGWCRIAPTIYENTEGKDINLRGSETGQYWIHNSCLGANGVGAGAKLRATPDMDGKVLMNVTEDTLVMPLEIRGVWVKVRDVKSKKEGWVLGEELCSNPLTTCA